MRPTVGDKDRYHLVSKIDNAEVAFTDAGFLANSRSLLPSGRAMGIAT
jgi:hypothetical protein